MRRCPPPTSASSITSSTRAGSQRSMRWMSCPELDRREHRAEHPGRVGDRRPHEVRRARRDPGPHVQQLGEQRAVAVHHALRIARGARRVREHAHVVRSRRRRSRRPAVRPRRPRPTRRAAPGRRGERRVDPRRRAGRDRGSSSARRAVDDVEVVDVAEAVGRDVRARPALLEDEAHLLRPVDVHDRHEHVPAHREPVERDDRLAPVRQLERDDVAGLDAGLARARVTSRSASSWTSRVGAVPRPCLRPDVDSRRRATAREAASTSDAERLVGPPPLGEVALPERGGTARTGHCVRSRSPTPHPRRVENHTSACESAVIIAEPPAEIHDAARPRTRRARERRRRGGWDARGDRDPPRAAQAHGAVRTRRHGARDRVPRRVSIRRSRARPATARRAWRTSTRARSRCGRTTSSPSRTSTTARCSPASRSPRAPS